MITNQDITIFNLRIDKESRREVFIPTNISEVSFVNLRASSGTSERAENLQFKIRIPIHARFQDGRTYVPEAKYKLMDDKEAKKHWTLQKGCYIIAGTVFFGDDWKFDDFDFSSGVITAARIRDFLDLLSYNHDIVNVTEYADNTTRGSDDVKHWRVGGQ